MNIAIKKLLGIVFCVLIIGSLSSCGENMDKDDISKNQGTQEVKYRDGEYSASAAKYDDQGYKPFVKIAVKDGSLYSINCDAENKSAGTKKSDSESGKYDMKKGGSQYEWHEEISLFEKFVVENGLENVKINSNGKTDVITGCTIAVAEYKDLINEALKKAKE